MTADDPAVSIADRNRVHDFLTENASALVSTGDALEGWQVVHHEYVDRKHDIVYFEVVATDGTAFWKYTLANSYEEGIDYIGPPEPVRPEVVVKRAVTYVPRLIKRES